MLEEVNIVSEVGFHENANGSTSLSGTVVGASGITLNYIFRKHIFLHCFFFLLHIFIFITVMLHLRYLLDYSFKEICVVIEG